MARTEHDVRLPEGPAGPRLLRTLNDRTALDLFLEHGSLSRSDVARMTGISKPTASQVLSRLEESSLVVAAERTSGRTGRVAQLYTLNPRITYAAAVDVTPGALHVQVADVTGTVVGELRRGDLPREPGSGPAAAVGAIDTVLDSAGLTRSALGAVVVAAPAAYDEGADQLVYARGIPGWTEPGVGTALDAALPCPVVVENDVTLAAVAEQRTGVARAIADFFLIWLDDGVGGAIVLDGRLQRGAAGGASELAFLPLPDTERVRRPAMGSAGAYQRWVDGRRLRELAAVHGVPGRDPQRIISTAAGDPAHSAFLDELAERYAFALTAVIAVLDPTAVVLAGRYVLAGGAALQHRIVAALDRLAPRTPTVLASAFVGNEAVIEGARHVALDRARDRAFTGTSTVKTPAI